MNRILKVAVVLIGLGFLAVLPTVSQGEDDNSKSDRKGSKKDSKSRRFASPSEIRTVIWSASEVTSLTLRLCVRTATRVRPTLRDITRTMASVMGRSIQLTTLLEGFRLDQH